MNDHDNRHQEPAEPERLRAALSRLNQRRISVPPEVDDTILRIAHEHLKVLEEGAEGAPKQVSAGRTSWWTEWWTGMLVLFGGRRWATLVAVVVMMIAVGTLVWRGQHPRLAAGPEDLNADGVVDMLDAFALARELRQTPASHPQLDLNGDGLTDENDVKMLAAQAVTLKPEGHS